MTSISVITTSAVRSETVPALTVSIGMGSMASAIVLIVSAFQVSFVIGIVIVVISVAFGGGRCGSNQRRDRNCDRYKHRVQGAFHRHSPFQKLKTKLRK